MRILALADGMNGVIYHRIYTPLMRLQLDGHATIDIAQDSETMLKEVRFEDYDLIVFNRWLGPYHYDILKKIAKAKTPYVIDVDDYWVLPKYNPAYWAYRQGIKSAIKDAIHYADAVTCTTNQLAVKVKELNKNVVVLPNCLDYEHEQWKHTRIENEKFKIGWIGGITHHEDLKLIVDAITRIGEEGIADFYLCGYTDNDIWNQIVNMFKGDWFHVVRGTNAASYGEVYKHFDLVVAPLQKTPFNSCKSELKILEASAYEVPVVVSAVEPYTNHIDNGGVIFAKPDEWYESIKQAMTHAKELGESNALYCRKFHNLQLHNISRLKLYESLCK